ARNIGNLDTSFVCSLDVDHMKGRGIQRQKSKPCAALDDRTADRHLEPVDKSDLHALDASDGLFLACRFIVDDERSKFAQSLQMGFLERRIVQYRDLHGFSLPGVGRL